LESLLDEIERGRRAIKQDGLEGRFGLDVLAGKMRTTLRSGTPTPWPSVVDGARIREPGRGRVAVGLRLFVELVEEAYD
jgi:hypothetical protein